MARTFLLSDLVTTAKQYAAMENESHVSDAEWLGYLSSGYAELFSHLVASGMRYFESTNQYTYAAGSTWLLPADFLSHIGVDYLLDGTSTGRRRPLKESMAQERNLYSGVSGSGEAIRYTVSSKTITLTPTPGAGQVYELVYVPQPKKLLDSGEEIDVVTPDGEQFLLWYAVFLARDKEDDDVRSALRERENAKARLMEWATMRAFHNLRTPQVEQDLWTDIDPASYWWFRRF